MSQSFDKLLSIMTKLRNTGGCPWDHEQTHTSLIPYLIEEAFETVDALESSNKEHIKEELGDLLLQIVFHAQIAEEEGSFNINNVIDSISEKLIRRHPHVFGNAQVKNASEVSANWEKIKAEEKKNTTPASLLDSIPKSAPALFQAYKITKKAAKAGFDWDKPEDVVKKMEEELEEIKKAVQNKDDLNLREEIGDFFFCIVNLARHLKVEPEEALRQTNHKFRNRFFRMEKCIQEDGKKFETLTLKELDEYWNHIKKDLSIS